VIIHTADADSDANARWFYDGIKAQGVSWDITGCRITATAWFYVGYVKRCSGYEVALWEVCVLLQRPPIPFTAAMLIARQIRITASTLCWVSIDLDWSV